MCIVNGGSLFGWKVFYGELKDLKVAFRRKVHSFFASLKLKCIQTQRDRLTVLLLAL